MNIAVIVRKLDVQGGTQRQALILAHGLMARGHQVRIYTLRFRPDQCYPALSTGIAVTSLEETLTPYEDFVSSFLKKISGFLHETYAADRLMRRIDPETDVLNPHDSVAYRTAAFFKKRVRRVPSVWAMNDVPALRWTFDKASLFGPVPLSPVRKLWIRLLDRYDRRTFIREQDTIAVLDHYNERLVRTYLERASVITRLGIDAEQFLFQERPPVRKDSVRLLANGIFFPHRRFEDVIEAVRLLRDRGYGATLSIVGNPAASPDYAVSLEALAQNRGVAAFVHFLGRVSEADLVHAYHTHDVFVFANDLQTWGHAPLEAMASGLPAVVSRGAGVHEVLEERVHALTVPPRNPAAIADAVSLLVSDPALYRALSRVGSAFVRDHIRWEGYITEMEHLFSDAVSQSSPIRYA